ncbi:hypothetical protein DFH07DRAFT_16904 [Mycena maculata]|uniref:Uncharacterized protein n=1 Tax=Mycena maculata TaxID=230809 RepID=A0AAD7IMX5_9AGAR|nr:hypothetical protein DFH07DRAFT_16904 [Mycena maculata]
MPLVMAPKSGVLLCTECGAPIEPWMLSPRPATGASGMTRSSRLSVKLFPWMATNIKSSSCNEELDEEGNFEVETEIIQPAVAGIFDRNNSQPRTPNACVYFASSIGMRFPFESSPDINIKYRPLLDVSPNYFGKLSSIGGRTQLLCPTSRSTPKSPLVYKPVDLDPTATGERYSAPRHARFHIVPSTWPSHPESIRVHV